jgi:ubiquinone/menaquinone biosynthesis C-methylase UbiE
MQIDTGIRRILSVSKVYDAFQSLTGDKRAREFVASTFWRAKPGDKVVDIGCGPGTVLKYLDPGVQYFGFDMSEEYVDTARKAYGDRGTFVVGHTSDLIADDRLMGADLVTCNGLLHHLDDDEAAEVAAFGRSVLAPGGRMVCVEPCFLASQNPIARWIIENDRGQNVRGINGYRDVLSGSFDDIRIDVMTSLLRIPYVHVVLEAHAHAAD